MSCWCTYILWCIHRFVGFRHFRCRGKYLRQSGGRNDQHIWVEHRKVMYKSLMLVLLLCAVHRGDLSFIRTFGADRQLMHPNPDYRFVVCASQCVLFIEGCDVKACECVLVIMLVASYARSEWWHVHSHCKVTVHVSAKSITSISYSSSWTYMYPRRGPALLHD